MPVRSGRRRKPPSTLLTSIASGTASTRPLRRVLAVRWHFDRFCAAAEVAAVPALGSRLPGSSGREASDVRLRFGDCVFDSDRRELRKENKKVPLTPKVFQLLEVLIAERPKALSKATLHERLWPETFVADANLANLVADLRDALGDDAKHPRIIRTVQRFGYAF